MAEKLSKTVQQLKVELGPDELTYWLAYGRIIQAWKAGEDPADSFDDDHEPTEEEIAERVSACFSQMAAGK